jgi:hypothetical protein
VNSQLLDNLDSTDFLRTNAIAGGDVSGLFGALEIGPDKVGTNEVDATLTNADVADTSSLTTAEINDASLTGVASALQVDGKSFDEINFAGPVGQSFQASDVLGTLTLSYFCDGEASNDLSMSVSTSATNASIVVADHDSQFTDADFDAAEGARDFETTLGVAENNQATITYRNGAEVVTAQLVGLNGGVGTGNPCLVIGNAIFE